MLKRLYIKNFALLDEVNVKFEKGFNIITGETGAGKSIIIGALAMMLGERATSDLIRSQTDLSIIEGCFDVRKNSRINAFLDEKSIESSDELLLRREISRKGQNRCFANDHLITNTLMKEIAEYLVDLHGQHQHQSLLRVDTHIDFLDQFGELDRDVRRVKINFKKLNALRVKIKQLKDKERTFKEKEDLYQFQLSEIRAINPKEGEEEKLENELSILENSEVLFEITSNLFRMLYEDEGSVVEKLDYTTRELENLINIES